MIAGSGPQADAFCKKRLSEDFLDEKVKEFKSTPNKRGRFMAMIGIHLGTTNKSGCCLEGGKKSADPQCGGRVHNALCGQCLGLF